MSNFISLAEEAAGKLMQMIIIERVYSPGMRIPNEKQLSEILSVSRTSVREAVRILIANGILEIRRGVGTFVTESPLRNAGDFLGVFADENKQYTLDALKLRLILEPEMARRAVLYANEKEKTEIMITEEKCRMLILEKEEYTYADQLFHKAVASASHNRIYEKLLPLLHISIAIILRSKNFQRTAEKSAQNALIYHKKLADAIITGDEKAAEIAAKTHIYNSIQILKEYS